MTRQEDIRKLLKMSPAQMQKKAGDRLVICSDIDVLHRCFAESIAAEITVNNAKNRLTKLILPVGPVGQYPILAEMINNQRISLKQCWFFMMDDYRADHRAASVLSAAASWFCASAGHKTDSAVMPKPPVLWWMDTVEMIGFEPHFHVDVSDFVELKREMLRCHKSQLSHGDNADFLPLEEVMIRQCEARGEQAGVRAAEVFRQHRAWKRTGAW
jgi:hypothetical protein